MSAVTFSFIHTSADNHIEAVWFDWRQLLRSWAALGKPVEKKCKMDVGQSKADPAIAKSNMKSNAEPEAKAAEAKAWQKNDSERNIMNGNVIWWLDSYASGKGHVVKVKKEDQNGKLAVKAAWGMMLMT